MKLKKQVFFSNYICIFDWHYALEIEDIFLFFFFFFVHEVFTFTDTDNLSVCKLLLLLPLIKTDNYLPARLVSLTYKYSGALVALA